MKENLREDIVRFITSNVQTSIIDLTQFLYEELGEIPDEKTVRKFIDELKKQGKIELEKDIIRIKSDVPKISTFKSGLMGIPITVILRGSIDMLDPESLNVNALKQQLESLAKFLGDSPQSYRTLWGRLKVLILDDNLYFNWKVDDCDTQAFVSRYQITITSIWKSSREDIYKYAKYGGLSSIELEDLKSLPAAACAYFAYEILLTSLRTVHPSIDVSLTEIEHPQPKRQI